MISKEYQQKEYELLLDKSEKSIQAMKDLESLYRLNLPTAIDTPKCSDDQKVITKLYIEKTQL